MRTISILIILCFAIVAGAKDLKLHYDRPAEFFEEALVIGNGKIGATVYGDTDIDRLSLNDITLWTGEPDTAVAPSHARELERVRELLFQERYAEAEEANKQLQGHFTQNYQPLGNLYIKHNGGSEASGYYRELDIREAVVRSRYRKGCADVEVEYFASSPDSVIAIKLTTSGILDCTLALHSHLPAEISAEGCRLTMEGYAAAHSYPVYYKPVPDAEKHVYDPGKGIRFMTLVQVIAPGSEVTASGRELAVKGGHEALILLSNETSFNGFDRNPATDGKDYRAIVRRNIDRAATKAYSALLARHKADYQGYFNRVELDLGATDPAISSLPTDVQLKLYTDSAQVNPELEALYFQYGRYLLISCSRTPGVPANLQGLWNEDILPPWSSNYTTNINLEENYWLAEVANLSEMHQPLLQFITNLSATGRGAAESYYGAQRGWSLGQNSDIWATTNPVGLKSGGPNWACWNMGGAWLATHIWENYLFTRDLEALRRHYPALKGAAEFCLEYLTDYNGRLLTAPSTSPENKFIAPDGSRVATSYGATSDLAMIRECLTDTRAAAQTLGTDSALVEEIDQALGRLYPYTIGSQGQLLEWLHEWPEAEPTHRHQSHLFGLYPGHHITPEATPSLAAACARTLELRGPKSTGWSTGWRVNLYARLLDGEKAYEYFRRLLTYISPDGYKGTDARRGGGTYPNLLDAHSPFQIDGNFGGAAGVAEMLVQSTATGVKLLPALPKQWHTGSVKGLRTRDGRTLDMTWADGKVTSAVFH